MDRTASMGMEWLGLMMPAAGEWDQEKLVLVP